MVQIEVSERGLSAVWQMLNDELVRQGGFEKFNSSPLKPVYDTVFGLMSATFFEQRRKQDAARARRKAARA